MSDPNSSLPTQNERTASTSTPSPADPSPQRWQFRRAWRALRRLFADPDDTRAVFEIIDALPGRSGERAYRRFAASDVGAQVLAERRSLLTRLNDRDALLAMPEGTLGRTYGEFMRSENISADGLVEASEGNGRRFDDDEGAALFYERLRDKHDLEHVVTGYGRDLRGESALLAFSFAQVRTPGIGLIVLMAYLESDTEERRLIREGWRRGRRAEWLAAADWEALLERPLDEVRATLRTGDLPVYEPVFSTGAPAAAATS